MFVFSCKQNKNKSSDRNRLYIRSYLLFWKLSLKQAVLKQVVLKQVQPCVMSFRLIKNYWVWQKSQLLIITRNIQINIHIILVFLYIFKASFLLLLFIIYHFNYVLLSRAYHHVHED